ncbi:hypothetical protein ACGC1H_003125 [Rhizoctonia solani]
MSHSTVAQPISTRSPFSSFVGRSASFSNNILPPEILVEIFFLVCNIQANACPARIDVDRPKRNNHPFSKEPVILSHVCSQWRQIVVSQASLWSHIDVFPDRFNDPILSARSETYAARSSQALLDVHIVISYLHAIPDGMFTIGFSFLTAIAPRIQSLTVHSACGDIAGELCSSAVTACFANCVPGILTQVSIETVIVSQWDASINTGINHHQIKESALEAVWLPVKFLRLELFWVKWDSKAFHGLTELRLSAYLPIGRSELKSILLSSPQLCVLELDDPDIEDFFDDDSPPTPIHLGNLEILSLSWVTDRHLGSILQLIVPGTKPLSLSILNPYQDGSNFTSKAELQRFVSRSNITRLCTNQFQSYPQLGEVLSLMPNVSVLGIARFSCDSLDGETTLSPNRTLDALYIIKSTNPELNSFTWPSIETFVRRHSVRKLTLWKCDFRYCGIDESGLMPNTLYTICPVVRLVRDQEPNPIEDWC